MSIIVGSTIAAYKMDRLHEGLNWISNGEMLVEDAARNGHDLKFFVAIEVDGRGLDPMKPLMAALSKFDHEVWTFQMNTGAPAINSDERLAHICTGRNLVTEYAMRDGAEWLFYVDTDLRADDETFTKLFAVNWPVTGGEIAEYCLNGPTIQCRRHWSPEESGGVILNYGSTDDLYSFPVEEHWNTAGYQLVHREIFRKLRWRYDLGRDLTDDPAWAADLKEVFGLTCLVRKDCRGTHDGLVAVERRNHDLRIY